METLSYGSWTEFRTRFEKLLTAVGEVLGPQLVRRTGLRYVDELKALGITAAGDWAGRIMLPSWDLPMAPRSGSRSRQSSRRLSFKGPAGPG